MRFISFILPLTSLLLAGWYAFHAWLSHEISTCTQGGGADDFIGGIIVGAPGGILAILLLVLWKPRYDFHRILAILPVIPMLWLIATLALPWSISTIVLGHHVCGADYDWYLQDAPLWEPAIPLVHLIFPVGVCVAAYYGAVRHRRLRSKRTCE